MSSVEDFLQAYLVYGPGDPREQLGALASTSVLGCSGCGGHRQGGPLGLYITGTGDARWQYFTVLTQANVVTFATIG